MPLLASSAPLSAVYDLALLDLDGVVYIGGAPVKHAPESLAVARESGMKHAYVTNNASRTPETIAQHLIEIGLSGVESADVVTSAQAAARLVARRVTKGARILVVGGEGLRAALSEYGLVSVSSFDDDPVAVVQGFSPDLDWALITEGTHAVRAGLPWIASNLDATFPTPRGQAPGNGSFVRLIARITGERPVVAGKPESPLFEESILRVKGQRPIVIGDRLDTDIRGAHRAALPSMLVMTGVTDLDVLVHAKDRPDFVAPDLRSLSQVHQRVEIHGDTASCGTTRIFHQFGRIRIRDGGDDALAVLRATVGLAWSYLDRGGDALDLRDVEEHLNARMFL